MPPAAPRRRGRRVIARTPGLASPTRTCQRPPSRYSCGNGFHDRLRARPCRGCVSPAPRGRHRSRRAAGAATGRRTRRGAGLRSGRGPSAATQDVVVGPAPSVPYPYPHVAAGELEAMRDEARRRVERRLAQRGIDDAQVHVALDASVAEGLRRIAGDNDAELMVVGSRGRGTVRAALLGSTSTRSPAMPRVRWSWCPPPTDRRRGRRRQAGSRASAGRLHADAVQRVAEALLRRRVELLSHRVVRRAGLVTQRVDALADLVAARVAAGLDQPRDLGGGA